jgi:hypothetical protein
VFGLEVGFKMRLKPASEAGLETYVASASELGSRGGFGQGLQAADILG